MGSFVAATLVRIPQVLVADIAEAYVAREAVMFALSLGLSRVIFQGDCLQVISAIARTDEDHSYLENTSLVSCK